VAVLPAGHRCRVQCQRPADTLVLRLAPHFYAETVLCALGESTSLVARYAAFDPFLHEVGDALRTELERDRPLNDAYLAPLAVVIAVHLARHYAASSPPASGPGQRINLAVTFVTGPSRTADIEQNLIRGVHGPGEVHVVFVQPP